jgi:hypothetical protein
MYTQTVDLLFTPPQYTMTRAINLQGSLQQPGTRFTRAFSSGFVSRKSALSR